MSTTLTGKDRKTERLPKGYTLTIVPDAVAVGSYVRKADSMGEADQSTTALVASTTLIIGPFASDTYHEVILTAGSVTYTIAPVDFEAPDETAKAAIGAYTAASVGTVTLLAAAREARVVQIVVHVTTVFADGDGAQPTLLVGETGDTDKFAAAAVFTDAADESKIVLIGTLSANKALLLTQTAGTGTTKTGAYSVAAIACPLA
jgi:hypothetical protein